jgi:hypothetical protein
MLSLLVQRGRVDGAAVLLVTTTNREANVALRVQRNGKSQPATKVIPASEVTTTLREHVVVVSRHRGRHRLNLTVFRRGKRPSAAWMCVPRERITPSVVAVDVAVGVVVAVAIEAAAVDRVKVAIEAAAVADRVKVAPEAAAAVDQVKVAPEVAAVADRVKVAPEVGVVADQVKVAPEKAIVAANHIGCAR